uniref:sensor histidine kinase n=1 Tax=Noviherbaspirillum sp. TaxID=1926288 RepID=UPI002FE00688
RENDPQAMRAIVESIAHTTDATVHLANRLLTLARAGHGAEADLLNVSLTDIARQAGLELAAQAVKKNIDLSLDAAAEVMVLGTPWMLHEMAINLIDNAIRYTPAGGSVILRVFDDGQPVLEVEDSGPGIPEAERERVFSPFYRVPSAQEVNAGGSGLGLAIVRDLAAMHRAAVDLSDGGNSGNGAGSGAGLKITVRFPADKA